MVKKHVIHKPRSRHYRLRYILTIRVDEDLYHRIMELRDQGVNVSDFIRSLLIRYLDGGKNGR